MSRLYTYGEQSAWVSQGEVRARVTVGYYSELDATVRRRYGFHRPLRAGNVLISEPLALRFHVAARR